MDARRFFTDRTNLQHANFCPKPRGQVQSNYGGCSQRYQSLFMPELGALLWQTNAEGTLHVSASSCASSLMSRDIDHLVAPGCHEDKGSAACSQWERKQAETNYAFPSMLEVSQED